MTPDQRSTIVDLLDRLEADPAHVGATNGFVVDRPPGLPDSFARLANRHGGVTGPVVELIAALASALIEIERFAELVDPGRVADGTETAGLLALEDAISRAEDDGLLTDDRAGNYIRRVDPSLN